jgi:TM2 domain-containing membrane protein YozV
VNVVVAAVLSLLFPGAGQAYNGQVGKGIGFGLFFLLGPIPLLFLSLHGQEWALWTISGIKVIVPLAGLVDAYEIRTGKRQSIGGGWLPGAAVLIGGLILREGVAFLMRPWAAAALGSVVK